MGTRLQVTSKDHHPLCEEHHHHLHHHPHDCHDHQNVKRHKRDGGRPCQLFQSRCSHLCHGGESRNHVRTMVMVMMMLKALPDTILRLSRVDGI